VKSEDGFDNILVVDGVPVVDRSKLDRLLAKMSKEFGRRGAPVEVKDFFVPWDDAADKSKGCVCKILSAIPHFYSTALAPDMYLLSFATQMMRPLPCKL
jgi:hypothetical protein